MATQTENTLIMITGASRGVGRRLASTCAARGYRLALVARDEAGLTELAEQLKKEHDCDAGVFAFDLAAPGGDRTYKLSFGTTSEPGRYVKSLEEPRDGRRMLWGDTLGGPTTATAALQNVLRRSRVATPSAVCADGSKPGVR